jgi:crotonobetainyl-CoA:carnitine CoA-transferase CaiB-like acyl-CoA transferase
VHGCGRKEAAFVGSVRLAETRERKPCPSPTFGQHSDEILAEHEYSTAEIATWRERDVVR